MESIMLETTGQKHTDKIKLIAVEHNPNDNYSDGFYASFEDGFSIHYYQEEGKKKIHITLDPEKADIALFNEKYELGFNTSNETGVWLGVMKGDLTYNTNAISKTIPMSTYDDDIWDDEYHLGCRNYPNCQEAGCGEW